MDHEVVEAGAGNSEEALRRLLQTSRSPAERCRFRRGEGGVVQGVRLFLGEDRTASSTAVTAALRKPGGNAPRRFGGMRVRLLISGGKPDKRRSFFETIEKTGSVELFAALSADDRDSSARAESEAMRLVQTGGKGMGPRPSLNRSAVGPNLRALASEVEELLLYVGDRVRKSRSMMFKSSPPSRSLAQAFALGEALGERNLRELMRVLDQELSEIRPGVDRKKSEIGLLFGLSDQDSRTCHAQGPSDPGHLESRRAITIPSNPSSTAFLRRRFRTIDGSIRWPRIPSCCSRPCGRPTTTSCRS
jgi:hypothetical protein